MSTSSPHTGDPNSVATTGTIYRKYTGKYTVQVDGKMLLCDLSPLLRYNLLETDEKRAHRSAAHIDPLVVGDTVRCINVDSDSGMIVDLLPRRNQFSRRSAVPMPSARPHEHIIAANVDQIVPVFAAAHPDPKWNMLDRYLVSAEAADLPALICITKLDLVQDPQGKLADEIDQAVAEYRRIGYPVLLVSAHGGQGLPALAQALSGHVSVLLGKSGVGKTSLLNALQPGLGLRVNTVNQVTGKGKHTTTAMEMFPLELTGGGAIIDTPGVREFGLWVDDGDNLDWFFPEMRPYIGTCRFGLDCHHDQEPDCAIRQAVAAGQIHPRRWQSYLQLSLEV